MYEMRAEQLEHTEGWVLRWHAVQPAARAAALCGHRLPTAVENGAVENGPVPDYQVAREEYCVSCVSAVREAMRSNAAAQPPAHGGLATGA